MTTPTIGRLASTFIGDHLVDIEPPRAELGRLALTNKLEMVEVEDDVLDVIKTLKRISEGFRMFADLKHDPPVYVLYHRQLNHRGEMVDEMVGAYEELDQRIVNLIRRIDAQGRGHKDLATELDKLDRERDREHDRHLTELYGDAAERLRVALRKDLGAEGSSVHMGQGRGVHKSRREAAAAARRRQRQARKANR